MTISTTELHKRHEWLNTVFKALVTQGKTKAALAKAIGVSAPFIATLGVKKFPSAERRAQICGFLGLPIPEGFKAFSKGGFYGNRSTGKPSDRETHQEKI